MMLISVCQECEALREQRDAAHKIIAQYALAFGTLFEAFKQEAPEQAKQVLRGLVVSKQ